jgi:mono/diheme cytochrome c family protein
LEAIGLFLAVAGLVFSVWALSVISGVQDWFVATLVTESKKADQTAASATNADEGENKSGGTSSTSDTAAKAKDKVSGTNTGSDDAELAEMVKDDRTATETAPDADAQQKSEAGEKPSDGFGAVPPDGGSPLETARNAEKGSLDSPYADYAKIAEEGHKKFMAAGCNGCHGGGGGGGMGPPLTNQIWVYGKDDDTLFRVVALGSDELQKQGYSRKGSENVVGPMPPMGGIVKSTDDMWKIIAWIRSVNPSSVGSPLTQ